MELANKDNPNNPIVEEITLKNSQPDTEFIKEFETNNIFSWRGKYLALPQALGPVDLSSDEVDRLPGVLSAESQDLLEERIVQNSSAKNPQPDTLFIEELHQHNIFSWRGKYLALPQALGPVDLSSDEVPKLEGVSIEQSLEVLKQRIAEKLASKESQQETIFIEELHQHNIFSWKGKYLGLPQALGPVDISSDDIDKMPGVLLESSLEALKNMISSSNYSSPTESNKSKTQKSLTLIDILKKPIFGRNQVEEKQYPGPTPLESYTSYNIIGWKKNYYGVPKILGEVDVTSRKITKLKGVLIKSSLESLRLQISTKEPILIERSNSYDVMAWKKKYYGLYQILGNIDVTNKDVTKRTGVFVNRSLKKLKQEIEAAIESGGLPTLIEVFSYFNIFAWKSSYFGVSQALGHVNITDENDIRYKSIGQEGSIFLMEPSVESLKQRILTEAPAKYRHAPPTLVEENYSFYNIVKWQDKYYGIPMVLGSFNLTQGHAERTMGVFVSDSVDSLKVKIINEAPAEYRQIEKPVQAQVSSLQSAEVEQKFIMFLLNENEGVDWEVRKFMEPELDEEKESNKDIITGE